MIALTPLAEFALGGDFAALDASRWCSPSVSPVDEPSGSAQRMDLIEGRAEVVALGL